MLYRLFNVDTDEEIGMITEEQLQFLIDNLEEENLEDYDYYIDENTLAFFEELNCEAELLEILRNSLDDEEEGFEIRYEPE